MYKQSSLPTAAAGGLDSDTRTDAFSRQEEFQGQEKFGRSSPVLTDWRPADLVERKHRQNMLLTTKTELVLLYSFNSRLELISVPVAVMSERTRGAFCQTKLIQLRSFSNQLSGFWEDFGALARPSLFYHHEIINVAGPKQLVTEPVQNVVIDQQHVVVRTRWHGDWKPSV